MKLPNDHVLQPGQLADPVLWRLPKPAELRLPPAVDLVRLVMEKLGSGKGARIQTFNRPAEDNDGPHWIALRDGVALHVDPGFSRYTCQITVYNGGWDVRGMDLTPSPDPYIVGSVYCVDTYSPHRVVSDPRLGRGRYYLAVSLDSPEPIERGAEQRLVEFIHREFPMGY